MLILYKTSLFNYATKSTKFLGGLYCSQNSLISNHKMYRNNIIVGIVNFVSSNSIGSLLVSQI